MMSCDRQHEAEHIQSVDFALAFGLPPAEEKRIAELVRKAVSK